MDKFVIVQKSQEVEDIINIEESNKIDWKNSDDVSIDSKEIKIIRDFIEKRMNNSQKLQVVEMIKESAAKYTINKNGYFINMNNIPHEILIKIKMFVDFTKENARELQKTEEILNEEKSRIENIDKIEDNSNFTNSVVIEENLNEKNINFEIFSLDGVQSEIFDEYQENNDEELEFYKRMILNEKRENSGYKIILKRYKKKYVGNKAKILKKIRDISRSSVISKSAKSSLNQNIVKPNLNSKSKLKKNILPNQKVEETDNIQEETQTNVDEYIVEEDEDDGIE